MQERRFSNNLAAERPYTGPVTTPLMPPDVAVATLKDRKWDYKDAIAVLALLLAGIALLEQHGVLGGAEEVEPAPVEVVETDS